MFWSARKILFPLLTLTMGGKPLHRWEGRSRSGMTIVLLKYMYSVHGCWGEVKYMSTYTAYDLRSSCGKPLHRWEGRGRSGMTIVVLVLQQCTAVLGWSMLC